MRTLLSMVLMLCLLGCQSATTNQPDGTRQVEMAWAGFPKLIDTLSVQLQSTNRKNPGPAEHYPMYIGPPQDTILLNHRLEYDPFTSTAFDRYSRPVASQIEIRVDTTDTIFRIYPWLTPPPPPPPPSGQQRFGQVSC